MESQWEVQPGLFILQYPHSLDFCVLPIQACNLINVPRLPPRAEVVSRWVWSSQWVQTQGKLYTRIPPSSHPKPSAPPPPEGCCTNLFCPRRPEPSHLPPPPSLQIRPLDSDPITRLSSDREIPAVSSAPCRLSSVCADNPHPGT